MALESSLRALVTHCAGDLTRHPDVYTRSAPNDCWAGMALSLAHGRRADLVKNLEFQETQQALRCIALASQLRSPQDLDEQRELAYAWVALLVHRDASSRSFYLQGHRVHDTVFYRGARNLQPNTRENWPGEWKGKLKFLEHPERLTVTELELALAIFDWSSKSPAFVWWLKEEPHILWRIHHFLLSRYAFYLLVPFERALAKDGFHQPPFRAGEGLEPFGLPHTRIIPPRLIGLTALGYLGLITVDPFVAFIFAGHLVIVAVTFVAAAYAGWRLYYIDVFKQNRGVLASPHHACRRILHAWGLAVLWSGVLAVAVYALWFSLGKLGDPLPRGRFVQFPEGTGLGGLLTPYVIPTFPVDWLRVGDMSLRWLTLVATAIVVGALVQWFWQDESAIEPI